MSEKADRIPIIVDCDTGIDDSLALLYAAATAEADLVAVTCSGGNVEARQVAENTRAVLELAGRADVEVALGREAPIARELGETSLMFLVHPTLTAAEIDKTCKVLAEIMRLAAS